MKQLQTHMLRLITILVVAWFTVGTAAADEETEPLDITFIANSFVGPSKDTVSNRPAIIHRAVTLMKGKINPTYAQSSNTRGWTLLQSYPNICLTDKLKTADREALGYFSALPKDIYPPHRLQANLAVAAKFQRYSSLLEMLNNTDIVIGIANASHYGDRIMPLVASHPEHFYILKGANKHETMLDNMVLSGRIDANFRPSVKDWPNGDQFIAIPFDEADPALMGYILCSKTETGLKTITLFNDVMKSAAFQEFFLAAHMRAFPESEHVYIKQEMQRIFPSKTKP